MHTYIDEAGPFIPTRNRCAVSCVGALVIRDTELSEITTKYQKLRDTWGLGPGEIKGRQLSEHHVSTLIKLLQDYDLIFEVTGIDMANQTESAITSHRQNQAEKLSTNMTDEHQESLRREVHARQLQLRKLPNQLYVQSVCYAELLYHTFQKATMYHAQRYPTELEKFHWIVDAKNKNVTPFEELWRVLLLPILQTKSLKDPFDQLETGDYGALAKYCHSATAPPRPSAESGARRWPFSFHRGQ